MEMMGMLGQELTSVHDTLVVQVLDRTDDDPHDLRRVPAPNQPHPF
jgi:hypothetical protein